MTVTEYHKPEFAQLKNIQLLYLSTDISLTTNISSETNGTIGKHIWKFSNCVDLKCVVLSNVHIYSVTE